MYLKESSKRRWNGGSRGGKDERRFNEKKWEGWGVLEGRFSEEMERLKMYLRESSMIKKGKVGMYLEEGRMKERSVRKNGKVGVCLGESSVRKWKG
jgi:hypothetical protein